jgi:hypothetical protein
VIATELVGGVLRVVLQSEVRDYLWEELADSRIGFYGADYARKAELTGDYIADLPREPEPTRVRHTEGVPRTFSDVARQHQPPTRPSDHFMTDDVIERTTRHRRTRRAFRALAEEHQDVLVATFGPRRCSLSRSVATELAATWGPTFGAVALEPTLLRRAALEMEPLETPAQFLLRLGQDPTETLFRIGLLRSAADRVTEALEAYRRERGGPARAVSAVAPNHQQIAA